MKINSLYISAFGGIKDLRLSFKDGFNVIYGGNENGKSTVMAFIKMMFYGSERGSSQLAKNIRKKYTPWDGSPMAGSIDFTHGGKNYRIEKEFRSSNSTDKATLCDLDFGTRQVINGDVGARFLGLSPQAFERSVFIGQFGFPESDAAAEGEINSKLSNIALTGDESVSFEAVFTRLEKAKLTLMSKSGRAGAYDKNIKALNELNTRLESAIALQQSLNGKKALIAKAEAEITELQKEATALKTQISAEQDVRNAEKLKRLLELKAELDALNDTLKLSDGAFIDEMYLRKLQFCISKYNSAKQKAESKKSETDLLKKSIEAGLNPPSDATQQNAQRLEAELCALENQKQSLINTAEENKKRTEQLNSKLPEAQNAKKPLNPVLLSIGIAVMLLGVVLTTLKTPLFGGVAAGLGLLLLVLAFILKPSNPKPLESLKEQISEYEKSLFALQNDITRISGEVTVVTARLEAINTALNSTAAVIEKQQQMLKDCEAELEALNAQKELEKAALLEVYSKYRDTDSTDTLQADIEEISQKTASQKELKSQISFLLKDLNGISYQEAEKKLETLGGKTADTETDFEGIKKVYENKLSLISDKKSNIAVLLSEIKSSSAKAENPEHLKAQIAELSRKTADQKAFCAAADTAMDILKDSFAEVRRSYGSVLDKTAAEIFSKLTNQKYGNMSISKSFDISVEQTGVFGSREIAYLSSGAADQAYLSLRLALSRLIGADGEALPILLDDALAQYDDCRMKTALEFLQEYSAEAQIILFTCHNGISDSAKELGAEHIFLS